MLLQRQLISNITHKVTNSNIIGKYIDLSMIYVYIYDIVNVYNQNNLPKENHQVIIKIIYRDTRK